MQVDDQLEVVVGGPSDGLLEVRQLALDERLIRPNFEGPVTDRQSDMVQAVIYISNQEIKKTKQNKTTNPAAAMAWKSDSVIQVSQCFFRADCAADLDCN